MKFEENIPQKDTLAQSYGTFVLCKDVYNARKVIRTAWDKEKDTLTIIIDLRSYHVRPKRPAQFSFSIQINDSCYKTCTAVKNDYTTAKTRCRLVPVGDKCIYQRKGCYKCYACVGTGCVEGKTCNGYCIKTISD